MAFCGGLPMYLYNQIRLDLVRVLSFLIFGDDATIEIVVSLDRIMTFDNSDWNNLFTLFDADPINNLSSSMNGMFSGRYILPNYKNAHLPLTATFLNSKFESWCILLLWIILGLYFSRLCTYRYIPLLEWQCCCVYIL